MSDNLSYSNNKTEYGKVCFTIEEYRKSKGISKNKIVINANIQRTQLQNYCNNKVARVDLFVLARLCNFLECEVSDIMKYEPYTGDKK